MKAEIKEEDVNGQKRYRVVYYRLYEGIERPWTYGRYLNRETAEHQLRLIMTRGYV